MVKLAMAGFAALALCAPLHAHDTTDPLGVSSASSTAGAFAVTSDTAEQRLRRTAVYIARVCNGRRLAERRECARIAGIINEARAEKQMQQAAARH